MGRIFLYFISNRILREFITYISYFLVLWLALSLYSSSFSLIGAKRSLQSSLEIVSWHQISAAKPLVVYIFPRSFFFFSKKKKRERARGKTSWTCLQSGAPMVIGAQGWTGSFFFFLCRGKKKEERC